MSTSVVVAPRQLGALIAGLRTRGYRVIGPTLDEGAIVYDDVEGFEDLPIGWGDEQAPGHYRLVERDDEALFGYAVGPHSWKRHLLPQREILWTATRDGDANFRVTEAPRPSEPMAFIGVRACELAAIAVQDRVLVQGLAADTTYAARRRNVALIAVNCGEPSGTCFCASMGTGPRVGDGADLVLTELLDGDHEIMVEAHTDLGRALLTELGSRDVTPNDRERADAVVAHATDRMGRSLDADGIHDLLLGNLEHPRWDEVADRCLTCTNCTLVCPTCFCTQTEDITE
ncbi:MAG: hypothetical protein R3320_07780, partial [Nitriliruptorales bacterium]|nr:hypothetical protein [Nitriliruptorales bacterium]